MKLFALIENVDENDFDISEGIAMLFESEQKVTDYLMDKIVDRFESFVKGNAGYFFDWEKMFGFHDEPKICEVETDKYYCPYDFNKKIHFKKFMNMNHEIFKKIDEYNKDIDENGPKYVLEEKVKTLEKKKKEITNLEKEISEIGDIKYPYMGKFGAPKDEMSSKADGRR